MKIRFIFKLNTLFAADVRAARALILTNWLDAVREKAIAHRSLYHDHDSWTMKTFSYGFIYICTYARSATKHIPTFARDGLSPTLTR